MEQHLIVKRIFIASPGDLVSERETFKNIINEINEHKAHEIGLHLEVLTWEKTTPGLGRPQELINKLLSITDLFIMILWKRWGTPSGRFSSGTEEEFYVAKSLNEQSGKPKISLFFKKIDLITEDNIEECKKVIDFRKKLEEDKELLYKSFELTEEWERNIRNLIYEWLGEMNLTKQEIKDEEETVKPFSDDILIEITYIDRYDHGSKNEIYFTISDEKSLSKWKNMDKSKKEELLHFYLTKYLYLTLGVNPYKGIMRYRIENNRYLFLGLTTFSHGASIDMSSFYIPQDYHQVITSFEKEKSIIDLHLMSRVPRNGF